MFRGLIYALVSVLLLTFVRIVMSIIAKGFNEALKDEKAVRNPGAGHAPAGGRSLGELVKDPVCGTFVSSTSPHAKVLAGQTYRFCSPACRDKFAG